VAAGPSAFCVTEHSRRPEHVRSRRHRAWASTVIDPTLEGGPVRHHVSKRVGTTALLIITGLIGALLLAPAAPAATISACQKKKGGAIRIVSSRAKCTKSEKKISWNTQGPAGKNGTNGTNGAPGAPGTAGAKGDIGPSTAFNFNSGSDTVDFNATVSADTTVATLNVPAGSYAVLSKVLINNNSVSLASTSCRLIAGATVIDSGFDSINTGVLPNLDRIFYVLSGTVTLAADGTLTTICHTNQTSGNYLDRTITAIKVGALG
jgi:hypothetical protein